MSVAASTWVWSTSESSGTARLVLLALADQADDAGRCYPSVSYIAKKCRVAVRTAHDALQTLESLGEIVREPRPGHSTVYRLTFRATAATAATAATVASGCAESAEVGCAESAEVGCAESAEVPQTTYAGDRTEDVRGAAHRTIKETLSTSPDPVGGTRTRTARRRPAARGTRLPADWQPSPALREWTRQVAPGIGWAEVEKFRDHWAAEPGQRGVKLNWDATWRNWVRREIGGGRRGVPAPRRSTTDERVSAGIDLARQLAAEEAAAANGQQQLMIGDGR